MDVIILFLHLFPSEHDYGDRKHRLPDYQADGLSVYLLALALAWHCDMNKWRIYHTYVSDMIFSLLEALYKLIWSICCIFTLSVMILTVRMRMREWLPM